MYIVLLSGGSGKRLWPLSNALRSKQYIKLLQDPISGKPCSMIQRVWGQLTASRLADNSIICASKAQVEIIRSQLGNVGIAVESSPRDTFPAVALSCTYLKDKLGASETDVVCIIPVDPFTDTTYFETLKKLPKVLASSGAEIALMGAMPTDPSSKYGYIVPAEDRGMYFRVDSFREKPDEATARSLIDKGALWNCGIFCLRIGDILKRLQKYEAPANYDNLYEQYELLPRTSFDYEVLEKAHNLAAVGFYGLWKDLGTWNALSEEMRQTSIGNCIMDASCQSTHVVNELDIPVVTAGAKNLMVVASYDGILIADKEETPRIKELVHKLDIPPMYEERRWGTIKVLDTWRISDGLYSMTRKVKVYKGQNLSYHYHDYRDEVWTILGGRAVLVVEGERRDLSTGDSIRISRGMWHTVLAGTELILLEVQVGEIVGDQDIHRIAYEWNEINQVIAQEGNRKLEALNRSISV